MVWWRINIYALENQSVIVTKCLTVIKEIFLNRKVYNRHNSYVAGKFKLILVLPRFMAQSAGNEVSSA